MTRRPPYTAEDITWTQSRCLRLILADFLPPSPGTMRKPRNRRWVENVPLSPGHHLVYFSDVPRSSLLLPDGTDSWYSPGPPFTRRLWAGGSMEFLEDIPTDGQSFHSTEDIEDVQVKGGEGNEKVYVRIGREIFGGKYPGQLERQPSGKKRVAERRTLLFMRDNRKQGCPAVSQPLSRVLKPTQKPDFFHTMVPTRELLFQFSALTLNAHAIHLDRQFCREIEGHRNLLVQGPLTVVLIIEVLRIHLQYLANQSRSSSETTPDRITYVEYRNLAALYADEKMTICVKEKEKMLKGIKVWDVWIESSDGGYAVKGTVHTLMSEFLAPRPLISKSYASRLESIISRNQRASSGQNSSRTKSRIRGNGRASSRHRTASQGDSLQESIPKEQVAFQEAIHKEEEDKVETENFMEAEVKAAREAEENALRFQS